MSYWFSFSFLGRRHHTERIWKEEIKINWGLPATASRYVYLCLRYMEMSSIAIVATIKICISEETYVAETKLLLCRKSLLHPFYVYIYIYVCFDVCVHFLHTLLWAWQSCLENKISLGLLERHCFLEVMQQYIGKRDVLIHCDLSQVKRS